MAETAPALVLCVPSKGRLQENAHAFFARAGLDVVQARGARDYRGRLAQVPGVEIAFLSASEIVAQLAAGTAHLGVTGEDLVRESVPDADARLALLTPLGFGHANVVVAVPQAWIDVATMADLEDVASAYHARRGERMRVATKYVNLTRRYFAGVGVTDYRIVASLGATEGAPAAGQAELIVDITTTGATLQANALKILDDGVILRSQANLVAALRAPWTPQAREAARIILSRIAAEELARTTRELEAIDVADGAAAADHARAHHDAQLLSQSARNMTFSVASAKAAALADDLVGQGARRVTIRAHQAVFSTHNPLAEALFRHLA